MSSKTRIPSSRVVRRLIDYNPETGEMIWLPRPTWMCRATLDQRAAKMRAWNTRYAGTPALNSIDNGGYKKGRIFDELYSSHRVAWCHYYGKWPDGVIDHIDGNQLNNRIDNLRDTTVMQNSWNCALSARNTSGYTGVRLSSSKKKWTAQIRVGDKCIYLGTYERIDDAVAARKAADEKYGFHENHGRHLRTASRVYGERDE